MILDIWERKAGHNKNYKTTYYQHVTFLSNRFYYRVWDKYTVLIAIFQVNLVRWLSPLILFLHLFPDCASSWHRHKLFASYLTQSHQVFLT